jgi:hypothetical protein
MKMHHGPVIATGPWCIFAITFSYRHVPVVVAATLTHQPAGRASRPTG